MGVPGLWDLLRPAAARTSLSTLSKEAFYANRNGIRALTIGIDASLWIFHAQIPTAGENPFLRTIFFKISTLLQHPVLPVFVFDGPKKPSIKRGQAVAGKFGTGDRRSLEFKMLLNECGLEWWNAPGEAEAELALMNRQGKIDAVLSDDVDALLFGAVTVLRNNSPTLSGTQASHHASSSRGDLRTYEVYRSSSIRDMWTSKPGSQLRSDEDCQLAMIFVALLAGGDYVPEGLEAFGSTIAFALAHAGFAEPLSTYHKNGSLCSSTLSTLHTGICNELRTNASGHVGRKYTDRASKLSKRDPTALFPQIALDAYLNPVTSASSSSRGWPGFAAGASNGSRGMARNGGRGDMQGMAKACEKYFEWGTKELVGKKFISESVGTFGACIVNEARLAVMNRPAPPSAGSATQTSQNGRMTSFFTVIASSPRTTGKSTSAQRSPRRRSSSGEGDHPPPYVLKIERTRPDPTNPVLTEYRILYETQALLDRLHSAMVGHRIDPQNLTPEERLALGMVEVEEDIDDTAAAGNGGKTSDKAGKGQARVWIAAWLVKEAWPGLVADWEKRQATKGDKSSKRAPAAQKTDRSKKPVGEPGAASNRFINYFTSTQIQPPPQSQSAPSPQVDPASSSSPKSRSSKSKSGSVLRDPHPDVSGRQSDSEELEVVEAIEIPLSSRTDIPLSGKSRLRVSQRSQNGSCTASNPTSGDHDLLVPPSRLSSRSRSLSQPRPMPPKQATDPVNGKNTSKVVAKGEGGKSSASGAVKLGGRAQPIDLCSSDDDKETAIYPHRALASQSPKKTRSPTLNNSPRPALGSSSRTNIILLDSSHCGAEATEITSKRTAKATADRIRGKSAEKEPVQTRLNLPVTQAARTSAKSRTSARSSPSPLEMASGEPHTSPKKKSKALTRPPVSNEEWEAEVLGETKRVPRRSLKIEIHEDGDRVWQEWDAQRDGRNLATRRKA